MRDGYTLTTERLTYDEREPDAHDIVADEVDPIERYVVRQYDRIVRTTSRLAFSEDDYKQLLGIDGIVIDPFALTWFDYVLLAEQLHVSVIHAQPETLPGT